MQIKKILPSKKFTLIALAVIVLGGVLFAVFFLFSRTEKFSSDRNRAKLQGKTVLDLMQADTDGDGILDWEEGLWGTDKYRASTFDGMTDAEYIARKRAEMKTDQLENDTRLTETERFAREFFASYMAIQDGGVDDLTMVNFTHSLGQQMVNHNLSDKYSMANLKPAQPNTFASGATYAEALRGLFNRAAEIGAGTELDAASEAIIALETSGETRDLRELAVIAQAYRDFAAGMIALAPLETLKDMHLKAANSAENLGTAVENMAKMTTDPVIGLMGISQYERYSEELVAALDTIETNLLALR